MSIRSLPAAAGWAWLKAGFRTVRVDAAAVYGAVGLFMACVLALFLLQALITGMPPQEGARMLAGTLVTSVLSIIVSPLLLAGMMLVLHARQAGKARAVMVFGLFGSPAAAARVIGFSLCMTVLYLLAMAAVLFSVGHEMLSWYLDLMKAGAAGAVTAGSNTPELPPGYGLAIALLALTGLLVAVVSCIGLGQVVLAGRSVAGALADGFVGLFRNLLPLLVLALCGLALAVLASLAMTLFFMVLVALHLTLMSAVLLVPVYLLLMFVLYVLAFGIYYQIWRDVAGPADGGAQPAEPARIEA